MSGKVRENVMPFEGVANNVSRRHFETSSNFTRRVMGEYMTELVCPTCDGKTRLNRTALSVKVNDQDIGDVSRFLIDQALDFFQGLDLSDQDQEIAKTDQ